MRLTSPNLRNERVYKIVWQAATLLHLITESMFGQIHTPRDQERKLTHCFGKLPPLLR